MKILVINGPNMNFLGVREKSIYGEKTYEDLCTYLYKNAQELSLEIDLVQSNIEGEIINYIQSAYNKYDGIVINPAAYTHYSIAIHDAIKSIEIPTVEVHISNVHGREEFRKKSVTACVCIGQISGFGFFGYVMGMMALKQYRIDHK